MPTIRKKLIIGEYTGRRERNGYDRIGEFEVNAEAVGYRRKLQKGEWQLVPYSMGNTPKIEIIISHKGTDKPYFVLVEQEEPQSRSIFRSGSINTSSYSEIIVFPMIEDTGKHKYSISVFSGIPRDESREDIILFRAIDRDAMLMWGMGSIFTGIIGFVGYLIGKYV